MPAPTPPVAPDAVPPRLAGWAFALLLALALASSLYGLHTGVRPEAPATAENLLSGELTASLGKALQRTPLPLAAARAQRALAWFTLGDLGAQVRAGCPGWLFLAEELTLHAHGARDAAGRARLAVALAESLRERGTDLVVAIVPDKTRVQAQALCGLPRAASLAPRAADWQAALSRGGVPAIDLTTTLVDAPGDTFLHADTHWNELGALRAARAVAALARETPAARAGLGPHRPTTPQTGPSQWQSGDLVRLAGLDWLPLAWQPATDRVAATRYVADTRHADADALFGDAGLPGVALVGTSYSLHSGFVQHLEHALATPVASYARAGGGFAAGAIALLDALDGGGTQAPRLVVWEIPERLLQAPLDAQERRLAARLGPEPAPH